MSFYVLSEGQLTPVAGGQTALLHRYEQYDGEEDERERPHREDDEVREHLLRLYEARRLHDLVLKEPSVPLSNRNATLSSY